MAQTWRPMSPVSHGVDEGPAPAVQYRFFPEGAREMFQVQLPGLAAVKLPLEATVGVEHSTYLARVSEIGGIALARPALIEVRYYQVRGGGIATNPGSPEGKQLSYETALGRALSPSFEAKCLACHGDPSLSPLHESGVACETCHGPGQSHVAAGGTASTIGNPGRQSTAKATEFCARCHAGFVRVFDPQPTDLLISSEAEALRNSECYVQTGGGIGCMNCHNPHRNPAAGDPAYEKACLGCHATGVKQAASCPVSPASKCISCHMPTVQRGVYNLADHWIRVRTPAGALRKSRTSVEPRRVFLSMILARDAAAAESARRELSGGADFATVARRVSIDPSAPGGGYLGEIRLDQTEPLLRGAIAGLAPGETSPVVQVRAGFAILRRKPRDFRYQSAAHVESGTALMRRRDSAGAIREWQAALALDPHSLQALTKLGGALGQTNQIPQAIQTLSTAVSLWPDDANARYMLGVAYGAAGRPREEIDQYRRAIDLDPELTVAYFNLGSTLSDAGRAAEAAEVLRRGLQINPLSAGLYYNLSTVLEQAGDHRGAVAALETMRKIEPFGGRQVR
jgi:tetratricopeptide (TPR) repeat protein